MKNKLKLESFIRNIPDFPKPGILFRDISTLIQNKKAFKEAVDKMAEKYKGKKIDAVVAVEARGFILGGAIAHKLGVGFIPVRKKGKLPWKTDSVTYDLEYGTDTLEIHQDALNPGDKVLIVDDLLATGGTVKAVTELVEQKRAKISGIVFLVELFDLGGKNKLKNYPVHSLIKFPGH
ncbi:MAG: adenine phosphoribosyltransferase [Candidatus Omnitrophica bacterium]|nr:adenine phosphoribosyltransferase [Candidatus Omnitrophota bacterium]